MPADPQVTKAKRVGAAAIAKAAEAKTKPGVNRSTASREAYKIKAEGLDAVLEALGVKPKVAPAAKAAAKPSTNGKAKPAPKKPSAGGSPKVAAKPKAKPRAATSSAAKARAKPVPKKAAAKS